jgi:hypothetical protein
VTTDLPTTRREALLKLADDIGTGRIELTGSDALSDQIRYAAAVSRAAYAYPEEDQAPLEPVLGTTEPSSVTLARHALTVAAVTYEGCGEKVTSERITGRAEVFAAFLESYREATR